MYVVILCLCVLMELSTLLTFIAICCDGTIAETYFIATSTAERIAENQIMPLRLPTLNMNKHKVSKASRALTRALVPQK